MSNTNNTVAVETTTVATTAAVNGNASKKQAAAITDAVMEHRNDRSAASKAVTDLNKKLGEALLNGGMTKDQLHAMVEAAKASVLAGTGSHRGAGECAPQHPAWYDWRGWNPPRRCGG